MSLKKILLVALATLVVCGGFALPCQAQNPLNRRQPLRWLGQGFSDGYHRKNPGYDTSYYNPYSSHNSNLISQSPEYLAIRPVAMNQNIPRRFFNGIPFSDYAAPPQLNSNLLNSPGQQFQGSFSPSVASSVAEDEKEDDSFSDIRRNEDDSDEPDDDAFGGNDDVFRGDDDDFEGDDNDFREPEDNDFRELEDDAPADMDDDKDLDVDALEDEVDTSDIGGLSGLNDSLSLDFE